MKRSISAQPGVDADGDTHVSDLFRSANRVITAEPPQRRTVLSKVWAGADARNPLWAVGVLGSALGSPPLGEVTRRER